MHNQSKLEKTENLEPVKVGTVFPVSLPDFNTRNEKPNVKPHIHNKLEIGYCFEGSGIFLISNKIFTFQAGDAVIINTNEVHIAKSNPGQTTSWGFLYLDPIQLLSDQLKSFNVSLKLSYYSGADFKNIISAEENPELTTCIRQILLERRDMKTEYQSMIRALVWQMLVLLFRYYPVQDKKIQRGDYSEIARIVPALNYINNNFNKSLSVETLAKLCFTSESNFRKMFHKAMNCAPQPFIIKIRLNIACTMLKNTNESILSIAQYCGYGNLSNFNRQFKKAYQISPREYRQNQ